MNQICWLTHAIIWTILQLAISFYIAPKATTKTQIESSHIDVYSFLPDQPATGFRPAYKLLFMEGPHAIIGAVDKLYNLSLPELTLNHELVWKSAFPKDTDVVKQKCIKHIGRENSPVKTSDCVNAIRVVLNIPSHRADLMVCGTHYLAPLCRNYNITQDGYQMLEGTERDGKGRCPDIPAYNNTIYVHESALYTGTALGPTAATMIARLQEDRDNDFGVNKEVLLRTATPRSVLNKNAQFVKSAYYKSKVYFFFRELSVEWKQTVGTRMVSRVAQVCTSDRGGNDRYLTMQWTSFFKATLICALRNEEHNFFFDSLESVTEIREVATPTGKEDVFYAVFNTPDSAPSASAVCKFRMKDIQKAFMGPFKKPGDDTHIWGDLVTPPSDLPPPYPTQCVNNTRAYQDKTLEFMSSYQIMYEDVIPVDDAPVYVQTVHTNKLTSIVVDLEIPFIAFDRGKTRVGKRVDVLFAGTTDGRLLKILCSGTQRKLVEDIQVFPSGRAVTSVSMLADKRLLLITTDKDIKVIPVQRCSLVSTCQTCMALGDPYCQWLRSVGCVSVYHNRTADDRGNLDAFLSGQNVVCPPPVTSSTSTKFVPAKTERINSRKPSLKSQICQPCGKGNTSNAKPPHVLKSVSCPAPRSDSLVLGSATFIGIIIAVFVVAGLGASVVVYYGTRKSRPCCSNRCADASLSCAGANGGSTGSRTGIASSGSDSSSAVLFQQSMHNEVPPIKRVNNPINKSNVNNFVSPNGKANNYPVTQNNSTYKTYL